MADQAPQSVDTTDLMAALDEMVEDARREGKADGLAEARAETEVRVAGLREALRWLSLREMPDGPCWCVSDHKPAPDVIWVHAPRCLSARRALGLPMGDGLDDVRLASPVPSALPADRCPECRHESRDHGPHGCEVRLRVDEEGDLDICPCGITDEHWRPVPSALLDLRAPETVERLREALVEVLPIAEISYDGDSWFVKDAGIEYEEAERRMAAARALLTELDAPKP